MIIEINDYDGNLIQQIEVKNVLVDRADKGVITLTQNDWRSPIELFGQMWVTISCPNCRRQHTTKEAECQACGHILREE